MLFGECDSFAVVAAALFEDDDNLTSGIHSTVSSGSGGSSMVPSVAGIGTSHSVDNFGGSDDSL